MVNAIAILRWLQHRQGQPARLTDIAADLELNPSTCFNLLKTLQHAGFVTCNELAKSYRLGPALLELGLAVAHELDAVDAALPLVRELVQDIEFAVLIVRQLPDARYLVVDKVESLRPVKVTIATGELFPPDAPLLAKCYLAWRPPWAVDEFLERWGLTCFTPETITDPDQFRTELGRVRRLGYACSLGEYYRRNTAIAAPVFDRQGDVTLVINTLAFAADIPEERVPYYGRKLRATAERITRAIGGRVPFATEPGCGFAPPGLMSLHPKEEADMPRRTAGSERDYSWSQAMDPDSYFKRMVPRDTRPGVWRREDIQRVLDEMDKHPKRYPAYRRFCALVNADFEGVPGASPAIFMGVQRIHPGEHVTPHRHNSVALYYWIQGSGKAIVGKRQIRFKAGDFFSCPAWHAHEFINDGAEDMIMIAVHDLPLLGQLRALFWEEPLGQENIQHLVKEEAASWTALEDFEAVKTLPAIVAETRA